MRVTKYLAGLALVLAAAVFFAVGSASAKTSAVNCGDLVNGNVSLNQDLICPSTDGLIVASPNTTIHLNGHKIVCPNDALPCWGDGDSGIFSNYNNTQVIGPGTVSGFFSDITMEENGANTIKSLNTDAGPSHATWFGVFLLGSVSNFVQHVSDTGSLYSIAAALGGSNGIDNNNSSLAGTGDYGPDYDPGVIGGGGGIGLLGEFQDILHGNVVTHANGDTEFPIGGISVVFSDHTLVQGNKVDHTIDSDADAGGPGFSDICSTYSTYTGNTANSNYWDGFGIYHQNCTADTAPILGGAPIKASFPNDHFAGLQVTMSGNLSKGNGYDGIYLDKADGSEDPSCETIIGFVGYGCNGSTITANSLLGNGTIFAGDGIDTYRTYGSHIFHNTTNGNGDSGMFFYEPAADGINGNTSKQNHEDGLTIYYDDTCEVTGPFGACDPQWVNYNTLVHNGEFGGFANDLVASIGNVANNNGTAPIDCVNINCVAHAAAGLAAAPAGAAKVSALASVKERPHGASLNLAKLPAQP